MLINSVAFVHAYTVINDEPLARECLNWTSISMAPLPVVLETTITDGKFICADQTPVYTFYCTVNGNNLTWYINDGTVTTFTPRDRVGRTVSVTYPRNSQSDPLYNVTYTLTHISMIPGTAIFKYVSYVNILPFNDSKIEVVPFNVSCKTRCSDDNRTDVCQSRQYEVAGMLYNIITFVYMSIRRLTEFSISENI